MMLENPGSKSKLSKFETEGVTFRMHKTTLNKLRNNARQKQISLNTLASQIFDQYLDYNVYAAKAGLISFPRKLLINLLDKFTEEEITQIAQQRAGEEVKDIVLLLTGSYNIVSFLTMIEAWIKSSGFPYKHKINDSRHLYVIQHDLSRKWSLYLAKLFKFVMKKLVVREPQFQITSNSLVFEVDIEK